MKHSFPIIAITAAALIAGTGQPAEAGLKGGVEAFLEGDYEQVVLEFKKVLKKKRQPGKAQLIMAHMYLEGLGVEINYSRAYQYLLPSAKKNNPWAQTEIAKLLFAGNGPIQSYQEANEYFLKAAMLGYSEAQMAMAHAHLQGLGAVIDPVAGYAWLNLAASGLSGQARDDAIALREVTAAKMTQAEISRAQATSLEWSENMEIVDPEIVSMMRQARENPKGPKTKITITFLGQEFTATGKSLGIEKELKQVEDEVSKAAQTVSKKPEQKLAENKPGGALKEPVAKKTEANKPASGATAGQSATAEQPGFFASFFGAIGDALAGGVTGIISSIFGAIFGSDAPPPTPMPMPTPMPTPAPAPAKVTAPPAQ